MLINRLALTSSLLFPGKEKLRPNPPQFESDTVDVSCCFESLTSIHEIVSLLTDHF